MFRQGILPPPSLFHHHQQQMLKVGVNDDDLKIGVKSTAVLFGRYDKLITACLQMVFVALMIKVGLLLSLGRIYFGAIVFTGVLFIHQQLLISQREKNNCFNAFLNNNYVGLAIFVGLAADYAFYIAL